jgi:hypothetical protein
MNIVYFVLIISVAFNFFMFLYLKWYVKHRTSGAALLPEHRTEINRLIADIDAATDRDSLLVEERIKKLKELLDDTDKRISVYVKELEKSRTGEALYTNLGKGIRAALKTEAEPVQQNRPASLSAVRPDAALITKAAVPLQQTLPLKIPAKAQAAEPAKPPSKRQIRAHIDLLVNEGVPPEEIASRLDISIAEVDLAMNLRRK